MLVSALVAAIVCAAAVYVLLLKRAAARVVKTVPAQPARVSTGEVRVARPNPGSVEGLEIRYDRDGLVRAARVGAMNAEHKELLLTLDGVRWQGLANAQKQEVVAAARSAWASRMCAAGPDIAYLVVETERGEIVGRADPHSVTVW